MDFATESLRQLAAILESDSDCSEDEDDEATDEALLQERAEAQKLVEFEQASQKLLVELSALEAEYEIEKSCREQAEAYAAQVNQENKKLKRISVALFPMLSQLPEDLLDGASEDKPEPDPTEDPAYQHLQQIKELQETVSQLLGEKEELAVQVKELQHSIGQLQEQLEEEQLEKRSLQSTVEWNQKALKRFKQASQLVTQGYGEVAQQPELEQDLRQHTEVFAHQMLVEQKEAKRQSMILKQSVGPDAQLLQALSEVAELTKALEEAKQEHQTKVEAQLATLRASLAAVEEEKQQLGQRLVQAEERNSALEERGEWRVCLATAAEFALPHVSFTSVP
uniref:Shootin-1 n=1 Tax=Sphenodon punctatus TaxID=8508 RepID=A0A8D0L9W1_SPHPU